MNRNRHLFMILLHTTITPVTHHLIITDYLVIRRFYVKRFSQNGAIKTKTFSKTLHILNPKFLKMRTNHSNLQKLFLIQRISSNKNSIRKEMYFYWIWSELVHWGLEILEKKENGLIIKSIHLFNSSKKLSCKIIQITKK